MDEPTPAAGEFLLYQTDDGQTRIECRFEAETVWLSQALMAELFQTTSQSITQHLKTIYHDGELNEAATCKEYLQVQREGARRVRRSVKHYNLDAILAVGYRVRSPRGTQFRQWATARLSEYLLKGFVMDDERLKNPPAAGSGMPDYFDEMLERIRDIRASERRMYLRVREIFALAADYQPSLKETSTFFQTIQNKLHFAATGLTAAEIIHQRADHNQANMGLTNWKSSNVRKGDVTVAKNYLDRDEIDELNRIVVMWLDFAEDKARRRKQVFFREWAERLDDFLRFNERSVLTRPGKVRKKIADDKAKQEYDKFAERRRAFLESEGERSYMESLEAAAKLLEKRLKDEPTASG